MKPKHRTTLPFAALSGLTLALTSAAIHAQTAWDGEASTTDYATALNWAGDIIPGNGNANGALIGSSSNQTVIYNTATSYTSNGTGKANSLLVGTGTNGVGSLTLSGSAGTLTFGGDAYNNAAWIGSTSGTSNATGTVTVSAGKLAIGSASGIDASINLGVSIDANPTGTKSGTLIINGGTVEVGRRLLMGANAVTATGVLTISSGTLNMRRTGSNAEADNGMIRLGTGNNTVNLDGGTAILSGIHLFDATNLRSNIYFNGTTLRANVANADFIKGSTAGDSVANANLQIKNGGLIFDTNNFAVTINDTLSNFTGHTGFLRKEGLNTLTLSAANTYSGGTTVSAGTLTMNNASALGSTSGQLTVDSGGTLDMGSQNLTVGNLTGTGGVISGTSGTRLLTIGQGNGTGGNFQGAINNGAGGTTALTKTGTGTITLSGTNGYSGGTIVSGGKLTISSTGTINSTSGISIGAGELNYNNSSTALTIAPTFSGTGGTLSGTGTITPAVTITSGNRQTAGSSVTTTNPTAALGKETFSGGITYNTGSIFEWNLTANTESSEGTRGTNYDAVNTASLGVTTGAIFRVILNQSQNFTETFWDTNRTWSDIFKTGDAGSDLSYASIFSAPVQYYNSAGVLTTPTAEGSFTISGSTLNWTAVPEPTTALAGLLLTAGLLRRRRSNVG